jgi:hypothetical protein
VAIFLKLVEKYESVVYSAEYSYNRVTYIEWVSSEKTLITYSQPGKGAPIKPLTLATITAQKILEKELRKIQIRGYVLEKEELSFELECIEAPVVIITMFQSLPFFVLSLVSNDEERGCCFRSQGCHPLWKKNIWTFRFQ